MSKEMIRFWTHFAAELIGFDDRLEVRGGNEKTQSGLTAWVSALAPGRVELPSPEMGKMLGRACLGGKWDMIWEMLNLTWVGCLHGEHGCPLLEFRGVVKFGERNLEVQ